MNVIIIAACIPTLRPLFLIIFKRASPSDFLSQSRRRQSGYPKQPSGMDPKSDTNKTVGSRDTKTFEQYPITIDLSRTSEDSQKSLSGNTKVGRSSGNSIRVSQNIHVEAREIHTSSSEAEADVEWGSRGRGGTAVPLNSIGRPSPPRSRERDSTVTVEDDREGVKHESLV